MIWHWYFYPKRRDTLYSGAVFDLAGGPVTITLPDGFKRFMSMQIINEDEYTPIDHQIGHTSSCCIGMEVPAVGIFFRAVLGLHSTWLVNSATHMWGSRRFHTGDTSRNSFWVALLTFGEGWHNNHHAHPQSSRHGLAWYELDLNWYTIVALRMLGLAWDVKARNLDVDKGKGRSNAGGIAA